MGRRAGACPRRIAVLAVLLTTLAALQAAAGAAACSVGDARCWCGRLGGAWLAGPSVVRPTCRRTLDWQGRQRLVDVYLPADVGKAGTAYTPWVHLHGVAWRPWFLQTYPAWEQLAGTFAVPLGGNAEAFRMGVLAGAMTTAKGDASASHFEQPGAILVVPHCCPDKAATGQIWNTQMWPCFSNMAGACANTASNDVAFLGHLLRSLPQLLPGLALRPAVASGYSNGGMLLQELLCKDPGVVSRLAGVAVIASILPTGFAAKQCTSRLPKQVPFVWVHGTADRTLPFGPGTSEGAPVLGAEGAVKHWARAFGCSPSAAASPRQLHADAARGVSCASYCSGAQADVVLCAVAGADHMLWEQPGPGWTAGLARWAFGGFKPAGPVPF